MTRTPAIQLCQKGRQIYMLQRQCSPQLLYKMMTWAANLHLVPKILTKTQGLWVQTSQFIIIGTVLNIFFSADKNVNKMKSLIFAFVLKAKQEQVAPCLWPNWAHTMKCWLLCIWNMIPASRGKQRHCSWQCTGLCWWKTALDASATLRAAHHCLQLGSSGWPLRQAQAPGFIPCLL